MSSHFTTKSHVQRVEKSETPKQLATKSPAEKMEKAEEVFEDKQVLKMLVYLTADFCSHHISIHDWMGSLKNDTASDTFHWLHRMEHWIKFDPNVGRKQESPAEWRPIIKLIVKTLKSLPEKDLQSVHVKALGLAFTTLRRESSLCIKGWEEDKEKLSQDVEVMTTMKAKVLEEDFQTQWEGDEASASTPFTTIEPPIPLLSTIDNVIEKNALSSLAMESVKPCTLMDLPVEVRRKILSHLLPNAQEIRVADTEPLDTKENWLMLRPGYEACHTAILRANRQLYAEGTAVLYNRAFRVMVTHKGVMFLKSGYSMPEINAPILTRYESRPNWLSTFVFHKVKQLQIQLWGTDSRYNLFDLRGVLINLCSILYGQPSLKNVRVDFYDNGYKPIESGSYDDYDDLLFDDDEPHPAQDKHQGQMLINNTKSRFWLLMRWGDVPTRTHSIPSRTTDLELILQPLKLLRNVGKARVNLTARAEKDQDMKRIARECQDAMMSSGPRDDSEVKFVDWCTEWGAENVLWNEWGDGNVLPDGRPYLETREGAVVKYCYTTFDPPWKELSDRLIVESA